MPGDFTGLRATMSPLRETRTEALTRGFDLSKVCMWAEGLKERDGGEGSGLRGRPQQGSFVPCRPPLQLGLATAPSSLATQKTQFLCISIRSLGDPSTHPDVPMGIGIIGATSWNTVKIN